MNTSKIHLLKPDSYLLILIFKDNFINRTDCFVPRNDKWVKHNSKTVKKSLITFILITFTFAGYAQTKGSAIQNSISQPLVLDFLKNSEPEVPKTQMMTDYLKNYQEKNTIKPIELPSFGTKDLKARAKELENIDGMIIVKPNLAAMIKMPVVKPDDKIILK
jgi:hypothetical protein